MSQLEESNALLLELLAPLVDRLVEEKLAEARQHAHRPGQLINTAEAARRLKVDERTVQRMCLKGRIPAVQIGNRWRIRLEDLPTPRSSDVKAS